MLTSYNNLTQLGPPSRIYYFLCCIISGLLYLALSITHLSFYKPHLSITHLSPFYAHSCPLLTPPLYSPLLIILPSFIVSLSVHYSPSLSFMLTLRPLLTSPLCLPSPLPHLSFMLTSLHYSTSLPLCLPLSPLLHFSFMLTSPLLTSPFMSHFPCLYQFSVCLPTSLPSPSALCSPSPYYSPLSITHFLRFTFSQWHPLLYVTLFSRLLTFFSCYSPLAFYASPSPISISPLSHLPFIFHFPYFLSLLHIHLFMLTSPFILTLTHITFFSIFTSPLLHLSAISTSLHYSSLLAFASLSPHSPLSVTHLLAFMLTPLAYHLLHYHLSLCSPLSGHSPLHYSPLIPYALPLRYSPLSFILTSLLHLPLHFLVVCLSSWFLLAWRKFFFSPEPE